MKGDSTLSFVESDVVCNGFRFQIPHALGIMIRIPFRA